MNELLAIIRGRTPTKIHKLFLEISQEELSKLCEKNYCQLFFIDGKNIQNKKDFFAICQEEMAFPTYFGHNWDAWNDCITDLSWFPASHYLFCYQNWQNFSKNSPRDWEILLDILNDAIAYWPEQNISFSVIFLLS
jgi:RNAse (barnase) inhibitor barstar